MGFRARATSASERSHPAGRSSCSVLPMPGRIAWIQSSGHRWSSSSSRWLRENNPMSDTPAVSTRWTWTAVVVSFVVTLGCAPKTARRQTDIMAQSGKVSVSAAVLRARVNDLVESFVGRIELTADRISAETDDTALRHRALVLKVDAVPAVYTA